MIKNDFNLRPSFIDLFFIFKSYKIYYEENLDVLESDIEMIENEQ